MTQKLATVIAGSRPIDFGTSITFNGALMFVSGRHDSPTYRMVWDFAANQITLSDVADDYVLPTNVPDVPGIPLGDYDSVSRPRFDAIFAGVCGEKNYQDVLTAIRAIAETEPSTNETAQMRRAWSAFNNPPAEGIGYPISDWTDPAAINPLDLTGSFFYLLSIALVGSFPSIKDWLIAGCVAWSELSA